eukprot:1155050-Pelagomonas_calceolata.AAC.3
MFSNVGELSTSANFYCERLHRGVEQQSVGVRVTEFHALADAAPYVPAAVAFRLQALWDAGVQIVSQLDQK